MLDTDYFKKWLNKNIKELGGHSACCIRLDNPKFKKLFLKNNEIVQDWINKKSWRNGLFRKNVSTKSDPWNTFPNAKL